VVIGLYEKTLRWVLARQTATLLVAVATLAVTVLLFIAIPKALPIQDTGVIQGFRRSTNRILH